MEHENKIVLSARDAEWFIEQLTSEQLEAIRAASSATNIPDERFTERLFDKDCV